MEECLTSAEQYLLQLWTNTGDAISKMQEMEEYVHENKSMTCDCFRCYDGTLLTSLNICFKQSCSSKTASHTLKSIKLFQITSFTYAELRKVLYCCTGEGGDKKGEGKWGGVKDYFQCTRIIFISVPTSLHPHITQGNHQDSAQILNHQ